MLTGFRGSGISGVCPESPGFPDISDLTRRLRVVKNSIHPLYSLIVPYLSLVASPPPIQALGRFPPSHRPNLAKVRD
jgi:hypothetical protein